MADLGLITIVNTSYSKNKENQSMGLQCFFFID